MVGLREKGVKAERSRRGWGGMALGLLVSAVLLVVLLRNVEWKIFLAELKRLRPEYVLLLIALFFVAFYCRAARWRYLLPSDVPLSTRKLFEATLVGFFATCVLPLRAGEFVRPWVLSRWQPVSFSAGFASIVTERVFDVITLLLVLGLCLSELENAPPFVVLGVKALSVVSLLILATMLVAYVNQRLLIECTSRVVRFFLQRRFPALAGRLIEMVQEFVGGLRAISGFRELIAVLLWSIALWAVMIAVYQVGLWAFGEFPSVIVGTTVTAMIAVAVAAPSAPGFLGTFQFGCVVALTWIYRYPEEFAIAYSVVLHSFQVVLALITGYLILRSEGLRFRELSRGSE